MNNKVLQTGYLFLLIFFTCQLTSHSQVSEKKYMKWFDSKIGPENTSLYNGFLDDGDGEIERNKSYKNTLRYYNSFEFSNGSLVYEKQSYYDVPIKYDIYKDELLLNLKNSRNMLLALRPIKNKVRSFTIDNKEFVNCSLFPVNEDNGISGFAEIIYKTDYFELLRKHKKNKIVHKTHNGTLFEFVDKNFYFIYVGNGFYRVNKQSDFIRIFPEYKKEIKKYKISKKGLGRDILVLLQRLQYLMSSKK